MFAQRISRRVAIAVAVCLVCVSAVYASTASWWHGLSQSQRNYRILDRAADDLGRNVGVECKEWVRRVVKEASQNVVTIPSTRSNNYSWESSSDVASYSRGTPPPGIMNGHIIQMEWTNAGNGRIFPHTAIILNYSNTGMTWIDSNWNGDLRVRTHDVTYADFYNRVGNRYTVYRIK